PDPAYHITGLSAPHLRATRHVIQLNALLTAKTQDKSIKKRVGKLNKTSHGNCKVLLLSHVFLWLFHI
ncbi:hypothetical protein P0W48_16350, partial [Plesiomonas shigelloides]|uniref:hypothetical protein n=1 Tax=Plesiomonas shigelloides TaxID=703 RepID=UPI003139D203